MSTVTDYRKRPYYQTQELLMAVIFMFLFQKGSRNNYDNQAQKPEYKANIEKLFGLKTPDLDTSNRLLQRLNPDELSAIKQVLVRFLIRKKLLDKYRTLGMFFNITIDGTGLFSFATCPFDGCPYKTSKHGKKTYYCNVLEAKLVCANGFSFSVATEFIVNPQDGKFDKQDCELKAFKRLAVKLKKAFCRLPIIITADGLYPNQTAFEICQTNGWNFIFTFKEGCLKSIQEEAYLLKKAGAWECHRLATKKGKKQIIEQISFVGGLDYKGYSLGLVELITQVNNQETRFVHITDMEINNSNCQEISKQGRMRWKIENQGFNVQKNLGYGLQHKYARKSFNAMQCYYQCLQIAHMMNQFVFKSQVLSVFFEKKGTVKSLMESYNAILSHIGICEKWIDETLEKIRQVRYC